MFVLYYPPGEISLGRSNQSFAADLVELLKGDEIVIVLLPNTRDATGEYDWKLKWEGPGDAKPPFEVRYVESGQIVNQQIEEAKSWRDKPSLI